MQTDTDRLAIGVAAFANVLIRLQAVTVRTAGVDRRLLDVGDFLVHVTGTASRDFVGLAAIVDPSHRGAAALAERADHRPPIGEHSPSDAERGAHATAAFANDVGEDAEAMARAATARRPIDVCVM